MITTQNSLKAMSPQKRIETIQSQRQCHSQSLKAMSPQKRIETFACSAFQA